MLCKLIKIHSTDLSNYANETFEDILIHICDGISDWEEIDKNEFYKIKDWIRENDIKEKYILVEKPETTLKFCIKEQIKKENERLEKLKKEREEYEKKKLAIKLKKQKTIEEREKKKLEELKKKYGEK